MTDAQSNEPETPTGGTVGTVHIAEAVPDADGVLRAPAMVPLADLLADSADQ